MNRSTLLLLLPLALPLAVAAQTKPATTTTTNPQQVTEVTEDLDPATGKVVRRTTRTITQPAGTTAPATAADADASSVVPATDATVSDFLREKVVVSRLTAPQLVDVYGHFMDVVHDQRQGWKASDWTRAASVLSSLNARYSQLRESYSLDDKLNIRSQQAEFQALRTARQIGDQVSNKL